MGRENRVYSKYKMKKTENVGLLSLSFYFVVPWLLLQQQQQQLGYRSLLTRDVRFANKLGQIGFKWEKSRTF